ncbi:MAG: pseudouridine synthase [Candidatus Gracilibacteria bacterium]
MRIAKFLANAGLGARRTMETYVLEGRVKVNGEVFTELGKKIDSEKDIIEMDGKKIELKSEHLYIALNKPAGYLSTTEDTHGRKTVLDLLSSDPTLQGEKLAIVGRLDKESEGLLLLTNDGALAHKLMHPSFEKEKEYIVHFRGHLSDEALEQLEKGVYIPTDEGTFMTQPVKVFSIDYKNGRTKVHMILKKGKKRQIRLMGEAVGSQVTHLQRIRIGTLKLKNLPLSEFRRLDEKEIESLQSL